MNGRSSLIEPNRELTLKYIALGLMMSIVSVRFVS